MNCVRGKLNTIGRDDSPWLVYRSALALVAAGAAFLFATAGAVFADIYVYWYQWGSMGGGNGQFGWPVGAAVAPNNQVYVADWRNKAVYND